MNEKEFINKIESLNNIKPNQEWVSSTRDNIFGKQKFYSFLTKPAFATASAFMLLAGILGYSHVLVSRMETKMANELERLAIENEIEFLSSALTELKGAKVELEAKFSNSVFNKPSHEAVRIVKEVAPSIIEIGEKEGLILGSLGLEPEYNEMSFEKRSALLLIEDLKEKELSEEDRLKFEEVEELFNEGNYKESFRKVLEIGIEE
jgi:hypothetical protein